MKSPVAFFVRQELDLPHLAHSHIGRHLIPARGLGRGPTVSACDQKFMAVQMNRMVRHREVAEANAHLVVVPHVQRVDTRKDAAVPGPQIEVQHGHDLGRHAAGFDVVGVEQKNEVAVHAVNQWMLAVFIELGVRDPKAHHAHGHLRHFVGMWVVHEGTGAARLEFVDKSFAHRNRRLVQARHAVHAVGQALAVPMHGGVFRQLVGDKNAHLVALHHLDGRAGALAVVAPHVGLEAGRHFAHHRLRHQMEFLDALVHAPRQAPAIERHDGVVRSSVRRG